MDSEDSRDASATNESDSKSPDSPEDSGKESPLTRSPSPNSDINSPTSPRSRTASPGSGASSRSSSRSSQKSQDSASSASGQSVEANGPLSPSPANSSRSSSPDVSKCNVTKSVSSRSSKSPDRNSEGSSRKQCNHDDGNTSDSSSASVDSSSRKNKTVSKSNDTQPEEISDGDMDYEQDKSSPKQEPEQINSKQELNIAHVDLSDVSDLEDSIGGQSDEEKQENVEPKIGEEKIEKSRQEDGEEQLDFEAEDGECEELPKDDKNEEGVIEEKENNEIEKEKEELEEGEVTDEDEARPEETEPRPVCRFFSRGQCTWGASCRFLHPGVTDKGNYTMFELIRPVVPGEFPREERAFGRPEPAPMESAWERGLRTAKEMLRKSIKRKEQDIDFEEKKMNLSLAQEEFDKENGYYGRVPSPEPRYVRHVPVDYPPVPRPQPEEYYTRRQVIYEPEYMPVRERVRSYRELPSHRMPDYYNTKYEEEPVIKPRKPKREVIVQRAEERPVRGDEWQDPWMRSKSPVGRKVSSGRKRSYSSGSSYSSSSSTHSSSETSRSTTRSRSRSHQKKRSRHHHVSPSVIVSERKAANERAALMNPPAPRKKAPSPGMIRVNSSANPPAPSKEDAFGRTRSKLAMAAALARVNKRRRSSKSSSESSGSSSSDSDSTGSSSSSSLDGSPRRRAEIMAKAMESLKSDKRQIKLNLKAPSRKSDLIDITRKGELQGKKGLSSPSSSSDTKSKKATSRREELLKQLKAVEDAIAKKRSKTN